MTQAIRKILLSIPNISQITFADEPFLRLSFSKSTSRYAQSWLYILRICRDDKGKLGYKYISKDLIAIIGYRNNTWYILPLLDQTEGKALDKLCSEIYTKTHKQVCIRKVDITFYNEKKMSFKKEEIFEDDTTAEKILQLQKLFMSSDGTLNNVAINLKTKSERFENLHIPFEVKHSLRDIPFSSIQRYLKKFPKKYTSYINMVKYLLKQKENVAYKATIFLYKRKIQGIFLAEKFSLSEAGLYCGLCAKIYPGSTEWMDRYFFNQLYKEGIETVYLGGSENEGIAEYVKKLIPYNPSYYVKTLLYADIKRNKNYSIQIRPVRESDFHNLAVIYKQSYNCILELDEHWTLERARQFIVHFYHRQPDLFFVAEYKKTVVGAIVAGVQPWWDGNHLVEGEIFVDPIYQKKGIGKQLLRHLFQFARRKYGAVAWDTFTHNIGQHPLNWYKKLGFREMPQWTLISGDIATALKRLS